ncbi:glycosyltransferase family 2 protein [Enterococcus faecium]|nr:MULTISPECIES: glycosyltransferase family 2 protein [Enterococcus]ELB45114.1 hypothetical protein OKC_03018 [Enterococcus faecium EnGen0044]EOF70255.1 hypothetical protein SEU_01159 [Enterococcus faecium EnGen0130]EGP4777837.1 glycosyltransferase family 2 protein [Enterococcus faecium]EGP4945477.1 glycosyltransferase family 2 protein [Enterococcus faecium]EGP5103744.1 glycosyltransferase family 2 protein [Enterococcus faecium]
MKSNTVTILLSTYNGEKYLVEQIESLIAQKDVEVNILVRDDGSTDATKKILSKYEKFGLIKWYTGKKLGPAYSFIDLIHKAPISDYYAFCDQDDIWLENKLSKSISAIKSKKVPCAYFSSKTLVNCDLKRMPYSDNQFEESDISLSTILFRSIASGCTITFNHELKDILDIYKPNYIQMHDSWVILLAKIFGEVIYDKESNILYRIHEKNAVGVPSTKNLLIKRIRAFRKDVSSHSRSRTASEILTGYGNLIFDDEKLELIKNIADSRKKIKPRFVLINSRYKFAPTTISNLVIRVKIILGWV